MRKEASWYGPLFEEGLRDDLDYGDCPQTTTAFTNPVNLAPMTLPSLTFQTLTSNEVQRVRAASFPTERITLDFLRRFNDQSSPITEASVVRRERLSKEA